MKIRLIILLLLATNIACAQADYMVYKIKGKVSKTNDKWHHSLKIGQLLNDNESIRLGINASVVLICKNYSTITLDQQKDYPLAQFAALLKKAPASITADYCRFMWDELSATETAPEKDRHKYMNNNIGAVIRGVPDIYVDDAIDTINNHEGNLFIRWKTLLPAGRVTFALYDSSKSGQLLFSTTNNSISLDAIKNYAQGRSTVYWSMQKDHHETGQRNVIRFWNNAYNVYYNKLQKASIANRESAEWYYLLGFCLEENHFFAEACSSYAKAARLNPGEKRYQATLSDMRARYF